MSWQLFFSKIYVVNLKKRIDRLIEVTEEMDKYGIDFDLITAIEDEEGARGLRDTMVNIFKDAHENKYESILVFEDDAMFVTDPNPTMEQVVKGLPMDWRILHLGGQITGGFSYRVNGNLLAAQKVYSTHATAYSKQCIIDILCYPEMGYPIDNFMVDEIQIRGGSYCTDPFLCTQRAGVSNIGNAFINWQPFLETRFNQKKIEFSNKIR